MKKALLIAALSVAATPAMASKARLSALNNAKNLTDIQDVFTNPAKATQHGDWLTFEMGATPTTNATASADPKAEGGFSRSMDSARWGFYMGHQYAFVTEQRANISGLPATAIAPDNMINLFYATKTADMAWGLGLGYTKTDKKTTAVKQDAMALTGGILMGALDASLTVGLANNYKDEETVVANGRDFKGKTALDLDVKYTMEEMTYSFDYRTNAGKADNGSGTNVNDFDLTVMKIGAERDHKMDGSNFFYGVQYTMTTDKDKATGTDSKRETSALPVYAGIEADAASWLVLRGSVTQNFILGTTSISTASTTSPATDKDTIANNTTVAAGAGLKFGKLNIDGTLAGATTGALNGSSLLANGSLTYMF